MEASLAMVTAGLAFAWLPEHLVAPALAAGGARALPLGTGATRNVSLYLVLEQGAGRRTGGTGGRAEFARHAPLTRAAP